MLKQISEKDMFRFLREVYPTAEKTALIKLAGDMINTLETPFDSIIQTYLTSKRPTELEYGEFSLSYIMAFCNCNFPQAVLLMDEYIKNPAKGKVAILRR